MKATKHFKTGEMVRRVSSLKIHNLEFDLNGNCELYRLESNWIIVANKEILKATKLSVIPGAKYCDFDL
jgi:hypothetical protein